MANWRYLVLWRKSPQDNWQVAADPPVQIEVPAGMPLFKALGVLGQQGWELVSAVEPDHLAFKQPA